MIAERRDAPAWMREKNSLGYYGNNARFFTVSFDPLPGWRRRYLCPSFGLVEKVLARLGYGAPEPAHACAPTDAAYHWFHRLPEQRQDEELERMLDCLTDPKLGDYNDWIKLTAGLWRADCPYEIWDTWCRKLPNYNPGKNSYKWSQGFGHVPNPVSIGTVISIARRYGYQPPLDAFDWTFPTLAPEDLTRLNVIAKAAAARERTR